MSSNISGADFSDGFLAASMAFPDNAQQQRAKLRASSMRAALKGV
jgi:hypothetical protein